MRFFAKTAGLSSALAAPAVVLLLNAVPVQAQTGSESPCDSETVVPAGQDALRADCEALWAFYTQLEDPGVLDDAGDSQWGPNNALSSWRGVTISPPGRVTALSLSSSGLVGTLPSELGRLTALTHLNLNLNGLSGSIPSELGRLSNLTQLLLGHNGLSGSIPSELGHLSNLTELYLRNNGLSGSIPSELGQLVALKNLALGSNNLLGGLPSELGRLSNLRYLWLSGNGLSGPIPSELGRLSNLTHLLLDNNGLSGSIPSELGQLTKLTDLNVSFNELTGPIPLELEKLTELTFLELSGNRLERHLPPGLSRFGPFLQADPDPFKSDPLRLVAYSEVHQEFTLGDKVWDVWFCNTPKSNVTVDQDETMKLLNKDIASYFHWLSNDRYRPSFDNAGLIQGPDLAGCERAVRTRRQNTPSNNRFIVIDDTVIFNGYVDGMWWDPSTVSVAAGAVSVVKADGWPEAVLAIITHEIGHALGFPHAYGGIIRWANGNVYEGDNPMDFVTGNVALGATTGTIAVNRYAAGWIDPTNVAIHPSGKSHDYELKTSGSSGTQMLVLSDPRFGVLTTLGARVAVSYDATIPKEGIEVYRVDQSGDACKQPFGNICWALHRRTQPFPPAELSHGTGDDLDDQRKAELTQHVHSVGDVFEVGTATVEVVERVGDSFKVRVVDSAEPTYAGRFSDEDGSAHEGNIEAIAARGVTVGCSSTYPGLFCPGRVVTRAQMMAFLARALGLEGGMGGPDEPFCRCVRRCLVLVLP